MKIHHLTRWFNTRALIFAVLYLCTWTAQAQTSNSNDWRYTVRPQDTVSQLARQFLKPSVSWKILAKYNGLSDPDVIQPGKQLRIPLSWMVVEQARAKLTAVSGDVQVKSNGGVWQFAKLQELLETGQSIRVGLNSSARLQFADASEMVIQPQTTVLLDTLSVYSGGYMADTRLRLQGGRIEVNANPQGRLGQQFNVLTPAAVATVRGTQFMVEVQDVRTLQQTTQGQVELVTEQGSVLVSQGFGSSVEKGERPKPPEIIKPAPRLQNPKDKFDDFPVAFKLEGQEEVTGWVMQVGLDPQMAQLIVSQQSASPELVANTLVDGVYYLRAWSLSAQGVPSQTMQQRFEVATSRQLQGPVIKLSPDYFVRGSVALNLPPLATGKRYWVQVTQDVEGRVTVWHEVNANPALSLPVPADPTQAYFLWIWVY